MYGTARGALRFYLRAAGTQRLDATRTLPISALNEPILLEPAFECLRIEYDLCMAPKPGPDESEGYRLRDEYKRANQRYRWAVRELHRQAQAVPHENFNKLALISS
jgi:hypothetical protein